jgi:hypothetical protein
MHHTYLHYLLPRRCVAMSLVNTKQIAVCINCVWLPEDEISVDIDYVMHYIVSCMVS